MTDTTNNAGERNTRRSVQGEVVSNSAAKTIIVRCERMFKHPKYNKYIRKHSKVTAHDETEDAQVGDTVELMECRPLSKTKRWRLTNVIARAVLPAGDVS